MSESLCRKFAVFLNRNIICILLRFAGIFFLYGYLNWFLYIELVTLAGPYITGLIIFVLFILNSISLFLGGVFADRLGRRRVLVIGSVIFVVGFLLLLLYYCTEDVLLKTLLLALSVIVLFGLGDFDDPATHAMISESVPRHCVARALSIFKVSRAVLASLGSAALATVNPFYIQLIVLLCIPVVIATSLATRETIQIGIETTSTRTTSRVTLRDLLPQVRSIATSPGRHLPIAMLILRLGIGVTSGYVAHYLATVKELSRELIGIIYAVSNLCEIAAFATMSLLREAKTAAHVAVVLVIVDSAVLLAIPVTQGLLLAILIPLHRVLARYTLDALMSLIVLLVSDSRTRGTLYGITYALGCAHGIGSLIGGCIYAWNPHMVFIVSSIVVASSSLLFTSTFREYTRRAQVLTSA